MSFFQRLRRTASTSADSDVVDDPLAGYTPPLDPLAGYSPSPRPVAAPPAKHIPPPASELADLVLLYRRRRDAIAVDLEADGTGEEVELQALSVVCHQYVKRFGGSREDAGRVLRPLTVGRR
jgi:hypothetical protein